MQHRNSIECDRLETKKPSEKSKKKGAEPEVVLYRRRIKMADTQPTNVQPTIENRDLEHATHLRFMRNGDINFGGRSVTWNKKRIRTFDKFLDELTNSVKLRNGAVFRVYTPHHGHRVTNFDKLEEGGLYVAAGQEAFKPLGYTEIDPNPRKRNNKKTTDYYGEERPKVEPVTHSKLRCSGKIKYNKSEGKIIKVWPNGDKVNPPRIILLSSYMQNDIDDIFRAVGERVSSLLAGSVTRLFALDGTRIKYPDQIHHGGQYVACINQEKLKRVAYKDHGAKGIMTTPRLDSKFLPPLSRSTNKSTKSSKFSTPDHSNPTSSYASEKSSKSNYTTKYKSRQQTKKEDDGVFHAKPVAHKRGSQDKVKKVDYDKDEGGVFKAKGKNQSTSGAQEVEETADTRTELPIDQREAETIEEEERVGAVKVPSGLELTKPPSIQSSQEEVRSLPTPDPSGLYTPNSFYEYKYPDEREYDLDYRASQRSANEQESDKPVNQTSTNEQEPVKPVKQKLTKDKKKGKPVNKKSTNEQEKEKTVNQKAANERESDMPVNQKSTDERESDKSVNQKSANNEEPELGIRPSLRSVNSTLSAKKSVTFSPQVSASDKPRKKASKTKPKSRGLCRRRDTDSDSEEEIKNADQSENAVASRSFVQKRVLSTKVRRMNSAGKSKASGSSKASSFKSPLGDKGNKWEDLDSVEETCSSGQKSKPKTARSSYKEATRHEAIQLKSLGTSKLNAKIQPPKDAYTASLNDEPLLNSTSDALPDLNTGNSISNQSEFESDEPTPESVQLVNQESNLLSGTKPKKQSLTLLQNYTEMKSKQFKSKIPVGHVQCHVPCVRTPFRSAVGLVQQKSSIVTQSWLSKKKPSPVRKVHCGTPAWKKGPIVSKKGSQFVAIASKPDQKQPKKTVPTIKPTSVQIRAKKYLALEKTLDEPLDILPTQKPDVATNNDESQIKPQKQELQKSSKESSTFAQTNKDERQIKLQKQELQKSSKESSPLAQTNKDERKVKRFKPELQKNSKESSNLPQTNKDERQIKPFKPELQRNSKESSPLAETNKDERQIKLQKQELQKNSKDSSNLAQTNKDERIVKPLKPEIQKSSKESPTLAQTNMDERPIKPFKPELQKNSKESATLAQRNGSQSGKESCEIDSLKDKAQSSEVPKPGQSSKSNGSKSSDSSPKLEVAHATSESGKTETEKNPSGLNSSELKKEGSSVQEHCVHCQGISGAGAETASASKTSASSEYSELSCSELVSDSSISDGFVWLDMGSVELIDYELDVRAKMRAELAKEPIVDEFEPGASNSGPLLSRLKAVFFGRKKKTELVEESNEKSEEIDNEEDEGRNRSKNNNSKTPRNNLPSQRQQKANSKSRSSNHSNQGQTTPREEGKTSEEEAAVKLQSQFRGYQVRKQLTEEGILTRQNGYVSRSPTPPTQTKTKPTRTNNIKNQPKPVTKATRHTPKSTQQSQEKKPADKTPPKNGPKKTSKTPDNKKDGKSKKDNNERETKAATTIQAGYRGFKTRKQLKQRQDSPIGSMSEDLAATKIQAGFRGKKTRSDMKKAKSELEDKIDKKYSEEEEKAATKIQAGFRGYKTRRDVVEKEAEDFYTEQEHKAAAKIQSGYRGFRTRKELALQRKSEYSENRKDSLGKYNEEHHNAAVKIQSGMRGVFARKELARRQAQKLYSTTEEQALSNYEFI